MTKGVAYSMHASALSATGLVAACAMMFAHLHIASEKTEQRRRAVHHEDDLSGRIAAKSDCEDSRLDALRARVGSFRGRLGPEDAWERIVRQFGKDWTAEAGPMDILDGYSFQVGTFLLVSPAISDWPGIIEAVKTAEQLPGVGIASIEMKSSGNREHRALDLVKIVVAIHGRRSGFVP
jgi:hypothetical protein